MKQRQKTRIYVWLCRFFGCCIKGSLAVLKLIQMAGKAVDLCYRQTCIACETRLIAIHQVALWVYCTKLVHLDKVLFSEIMENYLQHPTTFETIIIGHSTPEPPHLGYRLRWNSTWNAQSTGAARVKGRHGPQISSISCRFALWEAVSQTNTVARLKSKYLTPSKILGCYCPKAVNRVLWLARMCQVAWCSG